MPAFKAQQHKLVDSCLLFSMLAPAIGFLCEFMQRFGRIGWQALHPDQLAFMLILSYLIGIVPAFITGLLWSALDPLAWPFKHRPRVFECFMVLVALLLGFLTTALSSALMFGLAVSTVNAMGAIAAALCAVAVQKSALAHGALTSSRSCILQASR